MVCLIFGFNTKSCFWMVCFNVKSPVIFFEFYFCHNLNQKKDKELPGLFQESYGLKNACHRYFSST